MTITLERLESIIQSGDFINLLGESESGVFDCKSEIYTLTDGLSKYELAKDVSSFANANGGYILVGVKTTKSEKRHCDEVTEIRAFNQELCDPDKHIKVIFDWLYPKPINIEVKWYPTREDQNKGIFVIKIPNQPEIHKPFLIKRTVQETGKICEVLFGYCERKQESNSPKNVIELHQVLRDGLFYNEIIETRLQAIESALLDISKLSQKTNNEFKDIENRIELTLSSVNMQEQRSMVLTGYPEIPIKLGTLFSSGPGSLKSTLESPPKIREHGFGLRVLNRARIIKGMFCRVTGGEEKAIDLYKDGILIAGLKADEDFLCWAMRDLIFNPVALIESIYNFVQLYECVIRDMTEKPNKIYFRIDLKNLHLNNKINKLAIGNLQNIKCLFDHEVQSAPENNWSELLEVEKENFELSEVAYHITQMIYLYFGLDIEDIPYVKEIGGKKYIDIEQIKSI